MLANTPLQGMKTLPFTLMLVGIGAVLAWQMRSLVSESLWYGAPVLAVLVFAAVLQPLLKRSSTAALRRALLLGVGVVAVLASAVFAGFAWSFVLLLARDSWSFDAVWAVGALAAGAVAVSLWLRFYRIVRQT